MKRGFLCFWLTIAVFGLMVALQSKAQAGYITSQSPMWGGAFVNDSGVYSYNWRGSARVDYSVSGNVITIERVDQSAYLYGVNRPGSSLDVLASVSMDVYENGSRKVATIYPSSPGNYLRGGYDRIYGGISHPNLRVVNPTFQVNVVVFCYEAAAVNYAGAYRPSWRFQPDMTSPVPLLRYYNVYNGDHFYTTDYNELGGGRGGYVRERDEGRVFTTPASNTTRVYRYYNDSTGQHFYTANWSELGYGNAGYHLEQGTFYAYPQGNPNPSGNAYYAPMYRYFNPDFGGHFFSLYYGPLGGAWYFEQIAFWVEP